MFTWEKTKCALARFRESGSAVWSEGRGGDMRAVSRILLHVLAEPPAPPASDACERS